MVYQLGCFQTCLRHNVLRSSFHIANALSGHHVRSIPYSTAKRRSLTERDYRYYLVYNVKQSTLKPCSRMLSELDTTKPAQSDSILPLNDFTTIFESSDTTIEMAVTTLRSFVKRSYGFDSPPGTNVQRELYLTELPGKRALSWFLEHQKLGEIDRDYDGTFIHLVAFCLVAEKSHDFLVQWIILTNQQILAQPHTECRTQVMHTLNGFQARAMVEALAFWTTGEDKLRDAFDGFERLVAYGRKERPKFSLAMAIIWLMKALRTQQGCTSSAELFDRCARYLAVYCKHDTIKHEFELAHLDLYRSDGPRVAKAWDFITSRCGSTSLNSTAFSNSLFSTSDRRASYLVFLFFIRTAQVLNQQGRNEDARFVLDVGNQRMPNMFARGGAAPESFTGERSLRRDATEWERKLGWGDAEKPGNG